MKKTGLVIFLNNVGNGIAHFPPHSYPRSSHTGSVQAACEAAPPQTWKEKMCVLLLLIFTIYVSGFSDPKFETRVISMDQVPQRMKIEVVPPPQTCCYSLYILKLFYFPIFRTAATIKGFWCTHTAAVLSVRARIFVVLLHAVAPRRSCTGTVERATRFGFTN